MSEEARTISKFAKLRDYYKEVYNLDLDIHDGQFVVYKDDNFIHKFDTITYLEYWLSGFSTGYKISVGDYREIYSWK